jgi:hypothetical protein
LFRQCGAKSNEVTPLPWHLWSCRITCIGWCS